jgi:rhamnosyltransferase
MNVGAPAITVIIRARDEAAGIGRCLELVLGQERVGGRLEVIVVDSGSRDRTVAIAVSLGVRVLEMPPGEFTFGRALNLGARNAHGALLVSLSAHAYPPDYRWLARLAEPFADPLVACACGGRFGPDGTALHGRVRQDLTLLHEHPQWGYSNAAGAFRRALWRVHPFREDLPACEDIEWAAYWLRCDYVCVIDPGFVVDHDHSRDSIASIYRRARRRAEGFAALLDGSDAGVEPVGLVRGWWTDVRPHDSAWRARLSRRRAARLLGTYAGRTGGASRSGGGDHEADQQHSDG